MKLTLMKMKWKINSLVVSIGSKLGLIKSKGMYYMGGVNILPPPLKPDEEKLLIDRLEKDDSVKTILIERNLRLVVYISRKFENTGIDVEDLISIGTIGLIKAVNTFKSNKNIKLATYASRCIENEILMYLRKNNKKKAEVSFDEPLNTDLDGNELLLSDVLGTENDEIYKIIEEEIDTLASGALVPIETKVKPITKEGIFNFLAILAEPSTKKSAPLIKKSIPIINKNIFRNMSHMFFTPAHKICYNF